MKFCCQSYVIIKINSIDFPATLDFHSSFSFLHKAGKIGMKG